MIPTSRPVPLLQSPVASAVAALASAELTVEQAIVLGQFQLDYQPKLGVRSGLIDSAEALVRWHHPADGLRMPDSFIANSEDTGSIAALTLWTVEEAIRDQRAMQAAGITMQLFVNLSALLLTDARIVHQLCNRAHMAGVNLGIEITERSVIDDPMMAFANIRRLRDAGYAIAIDDYGAGLSSLTYLKQIEADELKIDKSFITTLGTSHRDPLIVRSTIDLAHALGMVVTAEGVETPAAHALLGVMGCDMVQGYLISRPLILPAFMKFMQNFDARTLNVPNDQRVLRDRSFWKHA